MALKNVNKKIFLSHLYYFLAMSYAAAVRGNEPNSAIASKPDQTYLVPSDNV